MRRLLRLAGVDGQVCMLRRLLRPASVGGRVCIVRWCGSRWWVQGEVLLLLLLLLLLVVLALLLLVLEHALEVLDVY